MGIIGKTPAEMRRYRAEQIARAATVFVRKARRNGHSNLITELLIAECAQELCITGEEYSVRTVKQIINRECAAQREMHLIAPKWGRKA